MELKTFLNYGGTCAEAFRFYEQHLGGKITRWVTWAQQPGGSPSPEMANLVLHARIVIGGQEIMGSDVPKERFQPMRSAYLSLSLTSTGETERIFGLLSEGGEVFMPMQETFFAHRFAMLRDRFGTSWMLIFEKPTPA